MNEKPKELHKQTSGNKTKKRKRNTGSILDAQDVYGELVGAALAEAQGEPGREE